MTKRVASLLECQNDKLLDLSSGASWHRPNLGFGSTRGGEGARQLGGETTGHLGQHWKGGDALKIRKYLVNNITYVPIGRGENYLASQQQLLDDGWLQLGGSGCGGRTFWWPSLLFGRWVFASFQVPQQVDPEC